MKKLLFAIIATFTLTTANASEKVIDPSELPAKIREFITSHFPKEKISIATYERDFLVKDYKVILTNSTKIEFDNRGKWTQIECKGKNRVPAALIPTLIAKYLKDKYPSNKVIKIEKDGKEYEVELDNDIELTFNDKGKLINIDN